MEFFWNLEPNTTYELGISATDDWGNESERTTTTITTLDYYTLSTAATGGDIINETSKTEFIEGETAQLTAVPDAGYTFTSWSEDACAGANSCTLVMDESKTVTANFTPIPAITWTTIAQEGKSFRVARNSIVRYGAGTKWVERTVPT